MTAEGKNPLVLALEEELRKGVVSHALAGAILEKSTEPVGLVAAIAEVARQIAARLEYQNTNKDAEEAKEWGGRWGYLYGMDDGVVSFALECCDEFNLDFHILDPLIPYFNDEMHSTKHVVRNMKHSESVAALAKLLDSRVDPDVGDSLLADLVKSKAFSQTAHEHLHDYLMVRALRLPVNRCRAELIAALFFANTKQRRGLVRRIEEFTRDHDFFCERDAITFRLLFDGLRDDDVAEDAKDAFVNALAFPLARRISCQENRENSFRILATVKRNSGSWFPQIVDLCKAERAFNGWYREDLAKLCELVND